MTDETAPSHWDRRRTARLDQYERVAMDRFAATGFHNVTVDEIAAAAGVSVRTLFRYFPTKEDLLLGYPRRGAAALVDRIESLPLSDAPLRTAWLAVREFYLEDPPDPDVFVLWRRAAAEAPEVVARATGERVRSLLDAVTAYCARSMGVDPAVDAEPGILAGRLVGVELAMVVEIGRTSRDWLDVIRAAERTLLPAPRRVQYRLPRRRLGS